MVTTTTLSSPSLSLLFSTTTNHPPPPPPPPPCVSLHNSLPLRPLSSLSLSSTITTNPLTVIRSSNKAASFLTNGAQYLNRSDTPCSVQSDGIPHEGDEGSIVSNADGVEEATNVDNQISLSGPSTIIGGAFMDYDLEDDVGSVAAVPKKRMSSSKTRIRKNIWKRKAKVAAMKAFSLAKSIYTGKSNSFMTDKLKKDG